MSALMATPAPSSGSGGALAANGAASGTPDDAGAGEQYDVTKEEVGELLSAGTVQTATGCTLNLTDGADTASPDDSSAAMPAAAPPAGMGGGSPFGK